MSVEQLREDIASTLATEVSTFKSVETHGGRFTIDELKRVSSQAPAAFVACLGVPGLTLHAHMPMATASWGIYIVVRGTSQQKRDRAALAFVDAVIKVVPLQTWGNACAQTATNVRADNLYNSTLDKLGIALWAVTWRQAVELTQVTLDDLVDFETLNAKYDMVDDTVQTDAEDSVTLETE